LRAASPARDALRAFDKGGKAGVDAFYARRIGKIYPGYTESLTQQPTFMAWPRETWTGGGYSSPAPGDVCRAGPLLSRAFAKRMFFAGEHTCPAFYGYMEGALQSGKNGRRSPAQGGDRFGGHAARPAAKQAVARRFEARQGQSETRLDASIRRRVGRNTRPNRLNESSTFLL